MPRMGRSLGNAAAPAARTVPMAGNPGEPHSPGAHGGCKAVPI